MLKFVRAVAVLWAFAGLASPAQAHQDKWVQVVSPHFTVASNSGEKDARRIAAQCEIVREIFHEDYPNLRVDSGSPLTVIAVKDEDSLKVLLPDFFADKNRMHPNGMFQSGVDESFMTLRTDLRVNGNDNPYSGLYQEYVYSVLRLNYSAMPLWLRTGIAMYYGNTIVDGNYTDVGRPTQADIVTLQRSQLIPLTDLMAADQRSPYYNERDRSQMFFVESWVLVHYLTLDPQAAKQDYLTRYMNAFQGSDDGLEAAQQTFGDLNQLQSKINDYARRMTFYTQRRPSITKQSDDYKESDISAAEALTVEADFLEHTNHMSRAREMLKEASSMQPDLAAIHDCLGFDDFAQHQNETAEAEFQAAFKSNPQDYRALYYLAQLAYRNAGYNSQSVDLMRQDLETAVQINPNFAPAWAFLSVVYLQNPMTREKALDAALKAHQLLPAAVGYVVEAGNALIALNRDTDARALAKTIEAMATTPQEKSMAEAYANRLAMYEQRTGQSQQAANPGAASATQAAPAAQQVH
jgi:tetratricopeptide (TPR) repeat protein